MRRALVLLLVPAKRVAPLDESAWQRGKRKANELANGRAVYFVIACGPIFAVGGLFVTSFWWPLRVALAAVIGLVVAVVAVLLISGVYALIAPYGQRREAREYARALEAHVAEYAQWAHRCELAEDFRWSTMAEAHVVEEDYDLRSDSELEDHWRANLSAIGVQLSALGADVTALIEVHLEILDKRADEYGDRHRARIRNSMNTVAQNLHAEIRQEQTPVAPPPPKAGGDR